MSDTKRLFMYILLLAVSMAFSMYMIHKAVENQHTRLQWLEQNIDIYEKTIHEPYSYTWSA